MSNSIRLHENFEHEQLNTNLMWYSPPRAWEINQEPAKLIVRTAKETDYWQKTH